MDSAGLAIKSNTAAATGISEADRRAARNWAANLRALSVAQPRLVEALQSLPAHCQWLFARDGYLSAQETAGQWLAGCSVPRAAAAALLKSMSCAGAVACFLSPTHAAQIRIALDKLTARQALLVIAPHTSELRRVLACDSFAGEILAHRLLIAWGEAWAAQLESLLTEIPGLAIPSQFVRLPLLEESAAERMIQTAQKVFSAVGVRRAGRIEFLCNKPPEKFHRPRLGMLVPGRFALWENPALLLHAVLRNDPHIDQCDLVTLDVHDPACASPLALAQFASECDGLLAVDCARSDLPPLLHDAKPWITFLTRRRIPAPTLSHERDRLIVADAAWKSDARQAGWPEHRLAALNWPQWRQPAAGADKLKGSGVCELLAKSKTSAPFGQLAAPWLLACDTRPVECPKSLQELSSHQLLWHQLHERIMSDPLCVGPDAAEFVRRGRIDANVGAEGFDQELFVNQLVLPAYAQSLARLLLARKLPIQLAGEGWSNIPELAEHAVGKSKGSGDKSKGSGIFDLGKSKGSGVFDLMANLKTSDKSNGSGVFEFPALGPAGSLEQLNQWIDQSAGLINPWPTHHHTALDAAGVPVIHPLRSWTARPAGAVGAQQLDIEQLLALAGLATVA